MYDICAWDTPTLLIFSDNVFASLIYYSHLLPLVLSLGLGSFIFFNNRKSLLNKILFVITLLFSAWSFFDLIVWATGTPSFTMFFWSLTILLEPVIYATSLYFLYVFVNKKDTSFKFKLVNFGLLFPTIVLLPTTLALTGFNFTNCDRDAVEGALVYYGYFIETVYVVWIFAYGLIAARKVSTVNQRIQTQLVTVGLCLFLFSLAFGNLIGSISSDWALGQYGLFGLPIFIGFLVYLIIKYDALDTKLLTVQITSFLTITFVFSLLFLQRISSVRLIVIPTLGVLAVLSSILIKSIKKEMEQRRAVERLGEQLETSNKKLKDVDKLKTEFLSLVSHQLRTPLAAIKGYASMLAEGAFGALEDKQSEAVRRIYTSAQGLTSLVEDLLNVSKIEQGGMKYDMAPTDLVPIVRSLFEELKIPARNKGLKFHLDLPEDGKVMVSADPVKIRQVFLNLADNSVKYTPKGFVHLILTQSRGTVKFIVSDTGIGITPETRATLFEKFTRGEGGKLNTDGSGLGLYLAMQITKAHKGRITIESEGKDKGSTLIVELPALLQ